MRSGLKSIVIVLAIVLASAAAVSTSALANQEVAPAAILHALSLQGGGITDSSYSAEPCTTVGLYIKR
jgi:hypothetical protein